LQLKKPNKKRRQMNLSERQKNTRREKSTRDSIIASKIDSRKKESRIRGKTTKK
jgi:hypothetical protein